MIIYGTLIIPLVVAYILYKYYHHHTVWWELFVPLFASLVFIVSMKAIIEVVQTTATEYVGGFVKQVEYYEPWNEYVRRTCTRKCGKNCTTTYDCSYVRYHPAYHQIVTTSNEIISISKGQYDNLKAKFGNESFVELNRWSYTIDGDKYCSIWQKDSINAVAVTTTETYENRIKAADQSVFHFGEVKEEDMEKYSLKEYPKIFNNYQMQSVLGDSTPDALLADKKFNYINGLLGKKKQVHVFVLIFKNQPIEAALYQEWFWSGGNKNEFIICIGIDNERNVKWCKPISWTKSEILKVKTKDFVQSQKKLNFQEIASFTQREIDKSFVRRDFKEFSYLTVEPPTWAVILTYILTILINIGLSFWIIENEH